jgi:hypothetical protein
MVVERRPLISGLKTPAEVDPKLEEKFVFGPKPERAEAAKPDNSDAAPEPREGKGKAVGRSPLTTRIRSDFSAALKRASLERHLQGVEPSAILDILEEALEPWLKSHGYIP